MPELPEMEAWRRALDDPVSAFPVEKAGPAHIATLKTFDPPLSALEGRRFAGAQRRGKPPPVPTAGRQRAPGIARAWANEILHTAQLSPYAMSTDLVTGQVEALAAAIDSELERGLELRERGAKDAKVYRVHKKLGEPCHACGTPIARVDFEEHTIYYCPECQTGGRVLKDRRLSRLLR